jgi:predicted phage tail protein
MIPYGGSTLDRARFFCMKTIVFSGPLREKYPKGIEVAGESAADCIALLQNYPEFSPGSETIRVTLPDFRSRDALYAPTEREVISVVQLEENPEQFSGSGQKAAGVVQVVIGSILIAVGLYTGNPNLALIGASMFLGGVLNLMMKAPEKPKNENENKSNYLAANKNTVKIGTTIPYLFGKRKVWGHLLSFNVTATNLNVGGQPYCYARGGSTQTPCPGHAGNYGGGYGNPDGSVGGGSGITYGGEWENYEQ